MGANVAGQQGKSGEGGKAPYDASFCLTQGRASELAPFLGHECN